MTKEKGTFRNSLFFLLGALIYSLLFWLSGKNHAHVFGTIVTALACYLIPIIKNNV
jgi:membrane associated rhomboid family serine protease